MNTRHFTSINWLTTDIKLYIIPSPLEVHPKVAREKCLLNKMVTLICCWNGVMTHGKAGISYEGPPPAATFIDLE